MGGGKKGSVGGRKRSEGKAGQVGVCVLACVWLCVCVCVGGGRGGVWSCG